jgi:glycosidase
VNPMSLIKSFGSPHVPLIQSYFEELYENRVNDCMERLSMLIGRYGLGYDIPSDSPKWSESTSFLITYGDMIQTEQEAPLQTLKRFADSYLHGAIDTIHILPFFPYSSDDGFSVIDYREVDPKLGEWIDIQAFSTSFNLMFDLVLNHCSSQSSWFRDFQNGIAPARDYFITESPDTNLCTVTRPRTSPLLTPTQTPAGVYHVWTTFSADQVDLNFKNPDVLFEFLDILLFYVTKGAKVMRLDAIAYLWKEIGTTCIHLHQTHIVVKLLRTFLEMLCNNTVVLTETNVPHEENISYFGDGDEAHIVYQFSLPPLLLHTLLFENASYLTQWAANLPDAREGCTFLNFTASHDGIGVRPLEGLVPDDELQKLVECVKQRGGHVSSKKNSDGSDSPYELNITYFDALSKPDNPNWEHHVPRFICSQTIMMGLKGIPAFYFHSLTATPNDHSGVEQTGMPRSINRKKWNEDELNQLLNEPTSATSEVFHELIRLLKIRANHPAFHPDGQQTILSLGDSCFAFIRVAPNDSETIVCISNVTGEKKPIYIHDALLKNVINSINIINNKKVQLENQAISLQPYETVWLPGS